ncbi:cAMP-dependent protein kinase inhibitor beta isoform X3 [Anolis carolinensis]|uniref:cAMP-dependent protein kinase inhibitor beta isoform X3 n=1 Tax=Anolis carolinensis TaxID=28377 RepID=UPI000462BDBC|nr:PREDICTED: cAMP-dependent protein kinase inhibitor beta isoform X2 [Anolis carolinensis]XP_008118321.1 PREDICTED: cAMP-dependent protein kinase inhibitor beta isoform X2 [Anolis carolinensis]XP_008118328.1 PREDICTED: cAMP-dependent protein kinase inhibitor beta isoform X2 [Anolis carolinensis]XP_016853029.1 PREDICTED: cAMP-dependent protein kinase inhibitor beta isoform X2 [Anolis carolinensis]XP_016853030.1 PREDICTED: cAMP-dependent protein kinase inhibitor beta isoform X2 [Anolis carolinen|eukprot:XP_008118317.1 PREDICTED: cAMP-dependent protein kinase inhibitor beta isoform X2 [Anolis carolinensis]
MTDVEPVVTDFAASGRAGRRNALPDILGSSAGAGTSDLPHKLAELSMSEAEGAEGGEASSSGTTMENQETEGKSMDS